MEDLKIHIGDKINEVLTAQRKTKRELGQAIGISTSASTYLTTRKSVDTETLWKISQALKYDFFKFYPFEGGETARAMVKDASGALSRNDELLKLKDELEKCRREVQLRGVEIQYLKKINELLERK